MRKYKTKAEKIYDSYYENKITKEECFKLLNENNERLEKKRKYKIGDIINTVDELQQCCYVYCFGKRPIHISFVESMQFRQVMIMLKAGRIRKAIKKEERRDIEDYYGRD